METQEKPNSINQISQQTLSFVIDSLSVYSAYIDAKTLRYLFVNKIFAETCNLSQKKIVGSHMQEILSEDNYNYALPYIKAVLKGQRVSYEYSFNVPAGLRWIKIEYIPEFDVDDKVIAFVVMGTDKTQQRAAEAKLKKSETYYRVIVETASEGIMILDKNLNIEYINEKLEAILEYEKGSLTGKHPLCLVFDKEHSSFNQRIKKRMQGESETYETLLKTQNGSGHWCKLSSKPMFDDNHSFQGIFVMVTDIHSRKNLEKKLELVINELKLLSNTDELTNLANRRCFNKTTFNNYKRWRKQQKSLCFMMLDIDYFKEFNDFYGHLQGDICLKKVANILAQNIDGKFDIVSRYGGDEFLCLVAKRTPEKLAIIDEKIVADVASLQIEHIKSEVASHVTVSLGLAIITCPTTLELIDCIHNADKALYEAKNSGRNKFAISTYTSPTT